MNTAGLIYENYFADEYNERFMESAIQGVSIVTDGELKTYGFPLRLKQLHFTTTKIYLTAWDLSRQKQWMN